LIKVTLSGIPAGMVFENSPLTANVATDGEDLRTIRYQWLADGQVVGTTNENTFMPAEAQVGKAMSVTLLYTDPAGAEHQVAGSNALSVLDVNDRPTGGVSVVPSQVEPNLRHAYNGLVDADGVGTVSWQWKVDGQAIPGATGSDYRLTPDQVDKTVTVVASYVDGRGHAESVASNDILNMYNDYWGDMTVTGTYASGQTLHAAVYDPNGPGKIYYTWETSQDGKTWTAVPGATGPDFTVGASTAQLLRATMDYADERGYVESHKAAFGGPEDDTVETNVAFTMSLGGGNDTIIYHSGTGTVDGGTGLDTFVAAGGLYVSHTPGAGVGTTDVWSEGGYGAHLVDVERVVIANSGTAYDADGAAGQAYRLYQAAFDRTPDNVGIGFWISRLDMGVSLTDVANAFVGSDEFKAKYGALSGNAALVDQFYANILHRAPDATGQAFWTNALDQHLATVAEVLVKFSESPENVAALVGTIENGISYLPYTGQ
jgi:hypothetical protein